MRYIATFNSMRTFLIVWAGQLVSLLGGEPGQIPPAAGEVPILLRFGSGQDSLVGVVGDFESQRRSYSAIDEAVAVSAVADRCDIAAAWRGRPNRVGRSTLGFQVIPVRPGAQVYNIP